MWECVSFSALNSMAGMALAYLRREAMMTRAWLLLMLLWVSTACTARADLETAVQVEGLTTGWADAGVVDGKHKIVPAATFTLRNVSDRKLGPIQINAVFRQVNDPREWSSSYLPSVANELAPRAATIPMTVEGQKGYTSDDSPDAMLRNTAFVDAKVELLVRSGSSAWNKVGEYVIDRKLIVPPNTNGRPE